MIQFGNILAFAAATGVLLPILIHLLSKKTRYSVEMGSLRFLKETETKTLQSIQINDLWKLALRLLIVLLAVLILAEPLVKKTSNTPTLLILVDPAYQQHAALDKLVDTANNLAQIKWMDPQKTPITEPPVASMAVLDEDFWSQRFPADCVVVVSPVLTTQITGKIPEKTSINRIIRLPNEDKTYSLMDLSKEGKAISVQAETSDYFSKVNYLRSETGRTIKKDYFIQPTVPIKEIVKASLQAIDESSLISFTEVNDPATAEIIFTNDSVYWYDSEKFVFRQDQITTGILENVYDRKVILTEDLNRERAMEYTFPVRLERQLVESQAAYKPDLRILPLERIPDPSTEKEEKKLSYQEAKTHFWWVLLLLFTIERFWSIKTSTV